MSSRNLANSCITWTTDNVSNQFSSWFWKHRAKCSLFYFFWPYEPVLYVCHGVAAFQWKLCVYCCWKAKNHIVLHGFKNFRCVAEVGDSNFSSGKKRFCSWNLFWRWPYCLWDYSFTTWFKLETKQNVKKVILLNQKYTQICCLNKTLCRWSFCMFNWKENFQINLQAATAEWQQYVCRKYRKPKKGIEYRILF